MNDTYVLPPKVEAFINAFKTLGGGELSIQAGEHLVKAVKATTLEQKESTVTVTLAITKLDEELINIEGTVTSKLPVPKIRGSFFVDTKRYLPTRDRPKQQILPN